MPASAAQVFGPTTVDPDFTTLGEKTLLTMATTLPAGGRNVIIVMMGKNPDITPNASGTFRIYKGNSLLYETRIREFFNNPLTASSPILLIAVDTSPAGNDSYSFRINISATGLSTGSVYVQGVVIKTDDAVWGYNTTAVSVNAGATATITSISTSFPANSKVAIVAVVYGGASVYADKFLGVDNIKLKSGATIVSSNQFNTGSFFDDNPARVSLTYLDVPASGSQTYSVEVTNGSDQRFNLFAEIVAFTVSHGAFLDTVAVSLTHNAQVTVGNLTTSLSGDVVVIGLAAAENIFSSTVTAFNANNVVLQLNNSSTGQISNLLGWRLTESTRMGRSGTLPLFRLDTDVSNPSYQIKMTAGASGIRGEAKILAFSLLAGVDIKKVFGETLQLLENNILRRGRFKLISEDVSISEASNRFRNLFRYVVEQINLIESGILSRIWIRVRDETINVIDAFQRATGKFRQALETLNIVESASVIKGRVLQISEMVRVSEIVTRVRQIFREVVEVINLNEALLISRMVVRVFGEFVDLLENVVRSRILNRVVNETERLVESFVSALGKVVGFIENVRILESASASRIRFRVINELVRISEVFSKSINMVKSITEQVRLSETFKVLSNKFRSVIENVKIDEFPSLAVGKFKSFMETVRIGETFTSFGGIVRQVAEIVNIGEVSSRLSNMFRSVVESVRIREFVGGVRNMFIHVLESMNIIESITSSRVLVRVRNELIEVGELFSSFMGRVKVVVENVRIVEVNLLKFVKTYIKRLKSVLMGSAKGGEL